MLSKGEVAALVARVAREMVEDLGITDPEDVGEGAVEVAYRRLWDVDKFAVEMHSDQNKVRLALREAAAERGQA